MNSLINRREIAQLLGVSINAIGVWDDRGLLPCRPADYVDPKERCRGKPSKFYDREIMLDWIEKRKAAKFKVTSDKAKFKVTSDKAGISFKQVFAGQFERRELKNRWGLKKLCAKHSNPKTVTVQVIGEW